MKVKSYIIFLVVTLLSILFIGYIYDILSAVTPNGDLNLTARKIETPIKLWLNGYLGAFFAFNYLGNINWLIIPLALTYYIIAKPTLRREHFAFIGLISVALLLIGLKGYFNPRYAFTLLPLFVFLVFDLTWKMAGLSQSKILQYTSIVVLIGLVGWNFYRETFSIRFKEKVTEIVEEAPIVIEKNTSEVEDVMEYLNAMKTTNYFLVDNAPEFYYHTSKKGRYYWNGDDFLYTEDGRSQLMEGKSFKEITAKLTKELDCKYIFSYSTYRGYNERFDDYLNSECKMIASDDKYRELYQIIYE